MVTANTTQASAAFLDLKFTLVGCESLPYKPNKLLNSAEEKSILTEEDLSTEMDSQIVQEKYENVQETNKIVLLNS